MPKKMHYLRADLDRSAATQDRIGEVPLDGPGDL